MGDYLKGKVAIVTGSGMGIGRAVAKALAAEGCKVVTNNRAPWDGVIPVDEEKFSKLSKEMQDWAMTEYAKYYGDAERTAQEIRDAGGEAVACFGDISDYEAAGKLSEDLLVLSPNKANLLSCRGGVKVDGCTIEVMSNKEGWITLCWYKTGKEAMDAMQKIREAMLQGKAYLEL